MKIGGSNSEILCCCFGVLLAASSCVREPLTDSSIEDGTATSELGIPDSPPGLCSFEGMCTENAGIARCSSGYCCPKMMAHPISYRACESSGKRCYTFENECFPRGWLFDFCLKEAGVIDSCLFMMPDGGP